MKYSFIVTVLCGLLVIGGACTHENDPEDGKRTNQTPLIVKATASNFNHLSISGSPFARTPLEDGAETQFSAGDAIGIFAVKNNAIADAVNNIKLTYKKQALTQVSGFLLPALRSIGMKVWTISRTIPTRKVSR